MANKLIDLTGQIFGYWKVIKRAETNQSKEAYWTCLCTKCNETVRDVKGSRLRRGESQSCGCNRNYNDLTGKKYGKLTVLKRAADHIQNNGRKRIAWLCQCDCGNLITVVGESLINGHTQSCGCFHSERVSQTHLKDLTGQKFGELVVLERAPNQENVTMWKCKCSCGVIKNVAGVNLLQGKTKSCGCLKSIGEENIKKILSDKGISFISQYNSFSDLNPRYKYDFYLPTQNRLIEFDGEQHYRDTSWGNYADTQRRDREKNEYALSHNIPLVRIPYWERDNITLEMLLGEQYLIKDE